jgi:hypothetical protein
MVRLSMHGQRAGEVFIETDTCTLDVFTLNHADDPAFVRKMLAAPVDMLERDVAGSRHTGLPYGHLLRRGPGGPAIPTTLKGDRDCLLRAVAVTYGLALIAQNRADGKFMPPETDVWVRVERVLLPHLIATLSTGGPTCWKHVTEHLHSATFHVWRRVHLPELHN